MIKHLAFMFLAVTLFAATASHCETDWDLRTMDGTVTAIDMREPSITVDGGVTIKFAVSNDTVFLKDNTKIRLLDLGIGDYIKVEYYHKGTESRTPSRLTKVELIYDASTR